MKKTAAFATKSGCTVMWVVKIGLSFSETPHRDTVSVKSIYQEHFSLWRWDNLPCICIPTYHSIYVKIS